MSDEGRMSDEDRIVSRLHAYRQFDTAAHQRRGSRREIRCEDLTLEGFAKEFLPVVREAMTLVMDPRYVGVDTDRRGHGPEERESIYIDAGVLVKKMERLTQNPGMAEREDLKAYFAEKAPDALRQLQGLHSEREIHLHAEPVRNQTLHSPRLDTGLLEALSPDMAEAEQFRNATTAALEPLKRPLIGVLEGLRMAQEGLKEAMETERGRGKK